MLSRKVVIIAGVILALLFGFGNVARADSYPEQQVEQSIKKAIVYLRGVQNADGGFPDRPGRPSSAVHTAWVVMALAAAGEDACGAGWTRAGRNPVDYLLNCGEPLLSTGDKARTLLALTAAGKGKSDLALKLADELAGLQRDDGQFAQPGEEDIINYHMWAVLALLSAGKEIPDPEAAKKWLLNRQREDGGFGWAAVVESDPDDTAVAVQVLIALGEDPRASQPVRKALLYLKGRQAADGGFMWEGRESNAATDAWVLQALVAAGEDPAGKDWTVNGRNVIGHLLSLQCGDGSFNWKQGVSSSPVQMTAYAVTALARRPFPVNLSVGLAQQKVISHATPSFTDLLPSHPAYDAVMELVGQKVLSGFPDGTFRPDGPVTRAEFTKFLIYGLGYGELTGSPLKFKDVPAGHWARGVIAAALERGYIRGRSDDIFDPNGRITGAELAAILVRVAGAEEQAAAAGGPYWYSGSVQVAGEKGLLYPDFRERAAVTRTQCAQSIVRLRHLLGVGRN